MRHLTNAYNPDLPDARARHIFNRLDVLANDQQALDFAWNCHLRWISENVRGFPKPYGGRTALELSQEPHNMIGVYGYEDLPKFYWVLVNFVHVAEGEIPNDVNLSEFKQVSYYIEIDDEDDMDAIMEKANKVCAARHGEGQYKFEYHNGVVLENTRYYPTAEHCKQGVVYTDEHGWETPEAFVGVSYGEIHGKQS